LGNGENNPFCGALIEGRRIFGIQHVDASGCWSHLRGLVSQSVPNRFLLIALLPACVAAAWMFSKAEFFWTHWPEMEFGWAVLMLCGFLFWEAWQARPEIDFRSLGIPTTLTVFGLALAFLFQLHQAAQGMNGSSMLLLAAGGLLIIFANLYWIFGARGVRHFAFPALFFVIALPMPTSIYSLVVSTLQSLVVSIDLNILSLLGVPAQRSGNLIQLPSGIVGVNEACSGIRSVQSTLMATLFIGHVVLKDRSLKVTLLFAGIALAIVGNVLRSVFLCLRADAGGVHAVESAHDAAGWSILVFTSISVAVVAWRFSRLDKRIAELRKRAGNRVASASNA
jgi:exosortase